MFTPLQFLRATSIAGLAIASMTALAAAGECPAGKTMDGATAPSTMQASGVTDEVIASIDLAPKGGDFVGQLLRMRRLTIAPGGVVPWHEHSERPANIYIISGVIEEYRANCAVPIVHKPGEVAMEFGNGFAHWWKNTGSEPVVLISSDIFKSAMMDKNMM